jgi:flagellar basal-body rod modification protein FlgD
MFVNEKMGPAKDIARADDSEFNKAKKNEPKRGDLPDFETLVQASNAERKIEVDAEAAMNGGGELKIGETKNDKEFRELLEKATGKKQDKNKTKLEKDDYLNLMVTQLKYQDPTKPMDNQEMASQMAQFNTVEQLMGVNKTLGEMKSQQGAAQIDKLTPYLGKNLEVAGNKVLLKADKSVSVAGVNLEAPANAVSVKIKDTNGNIVKSLALGNKETGSHRFEWDGKDDKGLSLPSGTYTFALEASTVEGKPVKGSGFMMAKAEGITDLASGGKLETSLGAIQTQDIIAIRADNIENTPKSNVSNQASTTPPVQASTTPPVQASTTPPVQASTTPPVQASTPKPAPVQTLTKETPSKKAA